MTDSARESKWYKRYSREVANMTTRYEKINAKAPTIVRKATPEETDYYMSIIEKQKGKK